MGVYTPLSLRMLLISDFVLQDTKKIFTVLSKLSQASMVKLFHFSDKWKMVSVAPQRGVYTPINLGVFFSDILATATRLNTL